MKPLDAAITVADQGPQTQRDANAPKRSSTMKQTTWAALVLAMALALAAPSDAADEMPQIRQTANGSYSPKLDAEFVIQTIQVPGFPPFLAARVVSVPGPNSPLRQLGLTQGDVITRLDGIPVTNFAELENHFAQTAVRYIKQGTTAPQQGSIFISATNGGGGLPPE